VLLRLQPVGRRPPACACSERPVGPPICTFGLDEHLRPGVACACGEHLDPLSLQRFEAVALSLAGLSGANLGSRRGCHSIYTGPELPHRHRPAAVLHSHLPLDLPGLSVVLVASLHTSESTRGVQIIRVVGALIFGPKNLAGLGKDLGKVAGSLKAEVRLGDAGGLSYPSGNPIALPHFGRLSSLTFDLLAVWYRPINSAEKNDLGSPIW